MGFRHFTHVHDLSFYQENEKKFQKTSCDGCDEVVSAPAYYCDTCQRFVLHEKCFELPREIQSPFHLSADHPLILLPEISRGFICNGCRNLRAGFVYNCSKCDFNLDVRCASPNNVRCDACNLPLSSEASYGCLKCYFFLHKSCLEIPREIQHRYHPHSLKASRSADCCPSCKTTPITLRYSCSEDDFSLHILCAKNSMEHTPPLRHKCHRNHDLYCFVPHDLIGSDCKCDHCDQLCESAFYKCFECDFNVHLGCIPIPLKVDYQGHTHPLTLKDSFCEDDSDVYYCYACGEKRNPNFPVYWCEWCEECPEDVPYVAHVECIVPEEDDFCRSSWNTSPRAVDKGLQGEPVKEEEGEKEENLEEQIYKSYWHFHPLIREAKEGMKIMLCDICEKEIEGDMYICEICDGVHLHRSCAELPDEITSPLHMHGLYGVSPNSEDFMCGLCKNVTDGYRYKCYQCSFTLELKCANLTNDQVQDWKEKHPEVRTRHFSHSHELTLVNCSSDNDCNLCKFTVSGSTYCCLDCEFFIHESCLEIQQQIQPSYHLQHRLIAQYLDELMKYCGVCGSRIFDIGYSCYECLFFVHINCGIRLTSVLKHKFHQHSLFSFSGSDLLDSHFDGGNSFRCCKCSDKFSDSFYRCVECDLNVHPECIPLPKIVKHSCHSDPLTLMSWMCKDDSGVYYCDICQEPRNPNHPVYWCQECHIVECSFGAHVGCVIQEGDTSLKVISWEDPEPIFGSLFDFEEADEISGYK